MVRIQFRRLYKIGMFGLRYLAYKILFEFHALGFPVEFGRGVILHESQLMQIGKQVTINEYAALKCIVDKNVPTHSPKLVIGDRVGMGIGSIVIAANKITLENDVILGPYCFVGDYDHEYEDIKTPIWQQPLRNIKPVLIKQAAWIGTKSTICAGVTIGKGCVIGANSVVTKDVPDYSLAVGVPAKVIKKYNPKTKTWQKV